MGQGLTTSITEDKLKEYQVCGNGKARMHVALGDDILTFCYVYCCIGVYLLYTK